MKALLYCVIREGSVQAGDLRVGLDGKPLQLVSEKDLAAVVSEIEDPESLLAADAPTRYHTIIARLHRERTVIPFRFRTLLGGNAEVKQLLGQHGDRFARMLSELDGCVEMGLRILLQGESPESGSDGQEDPPPADAGGATDIGPGAAYLYRRKSCYSRYLAVQQLAEKTAREYARHFEGLWNRITYDRPRDCPERGKPRVMISLYFLVPREREQRFRQAFSDLDRRKRAMTLMTGPWPPYNFVVTNPGEDTVTMTPAVSPAGPYL